MSLKHPMPAAKEPVTIGLIQAAASAFPPENLEDTLPKAGQEETVLLCEIDLAKVDVTRTHWPFLRDRRIDAYGYLTCRLIDE